MDPQNVTGEKPGSSDAIQSANGDTQDAKTDVSKEISIPSVFVNSEPLREDQVENAVKFLSHPKVRGSPVVYRRSFLEKKGLTKEEIDEAFRRVPDPTPTVSNAQADVQLKLLSTGQPQAVAKPLQTAVPAPMAVPMKTSTASHFHWSHALMAVGLLAVSGAGTAVLFKNVVVPRLKSWICRVVFEEENELAKKTGPGPSLAEAASAAAKAAAAAAADVAQASQEMLNSKKEERRCFEEFRDLLGTQIQEMKSMTKAIHHLEGQRNSTNRNVVVEDHKGTFMNSMQPKVNGEMDLPIHPVWSSSSPATVEAAAAPHPKSYMDIMAMVQRGEKPSNIMEINDLPPNPNQPLPNPRLAPRLKPWEVMETRNSSSGPWPPHKTLRIEEMGNEESSGDRAARPSWVPPQVPAIAVPEAAAAIRLPKVYGGKEQGVEDGLGEGDEFKQITDGVGSEIQEET